MTLLAFCGITLGVFVAFAFGSFLTLSFLPQPMRRHFVWVLAPGIGIGFCSLIFVVFRRPIFTVEFALLAPICVMWLRRASWPNLAKTFDFEWRAPVASLILVSALSLAATGLFLTVDRLPHGDSDGWAIWNTHARVLHRSGSNWRAVLPYTFHADYPLLTPAAAARLWRYGGGEIPESGAFVGILLCLSAVGILGLTLREFRDTRLATLLAFVLLGTPYFLVLASDQFADLPLSFFILATIALLVLYLEHSPSESGLLVIAGFTAGLAGWTKNEGLLFFAVTGVTLFVVALFRRSDLRYQFLPFMLGALAPLLVIVLFKFSLTRPNDLIESSNYQTLQGLLRPERHLAILKYGLGMLWSFGAWSVTPVIPLFAFVGLRGIDRQMIRSRGWLTGVIILTMMAAGYYVVYLVTPLDLQYHLRSSMDRLMAQLWPSFLLLLGLAARAKPESLL